MSDRNLWIRIGARTEGLMAGLKQAEHGVRQFNSEVQKSAEKRQALNDLGGSFMKVGAIAVAGSALAIKAAMDWEEAWTGVLKTVDGTPAQLEAVEASLRSLATETGFAHAEVAAVAEAAGQLGISTDGVAAFTETMLAMGVSTNMSAEEAATGLARFRNIMGTTEPEILNMGSTIVGLGNNFASTEGEILATSLRIAGAGRQAGLSAADVMGLATAMSDVGIEAEAGGTAMSLTMKRIGREVDSNGPKLQTFARVAGMSAEDFKAAWGEGAATTLTEFIRGLDDASAAGESVNGILTDLGITGIRESDAILRLSGNAERLGEALSMAGEEWSQNTALMDEAQKFYDTTAQKGKQAWAEIKDAAISAGDSLLPIVAKIADGVGALASAFGKIPEPISATLVGISAIGGASLIALGGLIKLHDSVSRAQAALEKLELSGGRAGAVLGKVGRAAGIAAAAVAALAVSQSVNDSIISLSSDVDELEGNLEKLGKTGEWSGLLKRNFDDAGTSIGEFLSGGDFAKLADDGFWTRLAKNAGAIQFGGFGGMTDLTVSRAHVQTIQDMDAALVNLARNDPEAAFSAFSEIREDTLAAGGSIKQLEKAFPLLTETMRAASESMGGTSDAAEILSGDLDDLAPAAQASAEAMAEQMESTMGAAMSFLDFSAGLDDAKLTLKEWIDELAKMQEAQDQWADNVIKAMNRGVSDGVIREFEKLGPAGAKMLKNLVEGPQSEIDRLNGILGSTVTTADDLAYILANFPEAIAEFKVAGADDAIETAAKVAEQYDLSDREVVGVLQALDYASGDIKEVLSLMDKADKARANPKVSVDTSSAHAKLNALRSEMFGLAASRPTILMRSGVSESEGGVLDFYANGGFSENHVAQIAPAGAWRVWAEPETGGEAYIPLAHSKRDRSLEIWAETGRRLGVQGFANGGISGGSGSVGQLSLNADIYLEGDLMARVRDIALDAAEQTTSRQQRFDSSQARALR